MYIPQTYGISLVFMFITMLCLGSWANAQKLNKDWQFELFYWDYALGVLLTSIFFAFTFGFIGNSGETFFGNLAHISFVSFGKAFLTGIIFNIANILLVAAIAIAGMSVAFPIGIGIALVAGTIFSYDVLPKGSAFLLFLGVLFVLVAIILDAIADKRKQAITEGSVKKGIIISIISGVLMSLFYPFIAASMKGDHSLTPLYGCFLFLHRSVPQ